MIDMVAAVCTRGTLHSRTAEAMDVNLMNCGLRWDRVWEHKKKIPDAQNSVIERALALDPVWVWMVEEDVEPPPDALATMLKVQHPVVAMTYKIPGGQMCHAVNAQGRLIFAGTGCLLVHADIWRMLPQPWFRTDLLYSYDAFTGKWGEPSMSGEQHYGKHDIHLFATMAAKGIYGALAEGVCKHWRVKAWGKAESNDGCHLIEELT